MSLYQAIRGSLATQAATVTGFPAAAQRAYEAMKFTPTIGVPHVRLALQPASGRPAVVGALTKLHLGIYLIDLFYPTTFDGGSGAVDVVADAVRDAFAPGNSFTQSGETVTVDYAERGPLVPEPDWLHIPVTVGWRCYSSSN